MTIALITRTVASACSWVAFSVIMLLYAWPDLVSGAKTGLLFGITAGLAIGLLDLWLLRTVYYRAPWWTLPLNVLAWTLGSLSSGSIWGVSGPHAYELRCVVIGAGTSLILAIVVAFPLSPLVIVRDKSTVSWFSLWILAWVGSTVIAWLVGLLTGKLIGLLFGWAAWTLSLFLGAGLGIMAGALIHGLLISAVLYSQLYKRSIIEPSVPHKSEVNVTSMR